MKSLPERKCCLENNSEFLQLVVDSSDCDTSICYMCFCLQVSIKIHFPVHFFWKIHVSAMVLYFLRLKFFRRMAKQGKKKLDCFSYWQYLGRPSSFDTFQSSVMKKFSTIKAMTFVLNENFFALVRHIRGQITSCSEVNHNFHLSLWDNLEKHGTP